MSKPILPLLVAFFRELSHTILEYPVVHARKQFGLK